MLGQVRRRPVSLTGSCVSIAMCMPGRRLDDVQMVADHVLAGEPLLAAVLVEDVAA
jgi:hypothetical protein